MTKEHLIAIARAYALIDGSYDLHAYLPRTETEAAGGKAMAKFRQPGVGIAFGFGPPVHKRVRPQGSEAR